MLVGDVMARDVLAVGPETSLATVVRLLTLHDISGLPVIDDKGRAVGVVSKGNLIDEPSRRSGLEPRPEYYRLRLGEITAVGTTDQPRLPTSGVVADVMSPVVLTVDRNATVFDAARLMVHEDVHRLIVIGDGRVRGVVTVLDCLRAIVGAVEGLRVSVQ
jgi:CBS domain-containing protein